MNHADNTSPFIRYTREEWAKLRANTPLTLTACDVDSLRSKDEPVNLREVEEVYLPLSRLLSMFATARARFRDDLSQFTGRVAQDDKVPWVIAIAGSVSVGKSTTARLLQALLSRWPTTPHVELVTTDGFLRSNAELEFLGLEARKGFPESYDQVGLLRFLQSMKSAHPVASVPVYDHKIYDIVPGAERIIPRCDILILEGLNVLQPAPLRNNGGLAVSDYIDFSIYVDANEHDLERWFIARFERHLEAAKHDQDSFFRQWVDLPEEEALWLAKTVWKDINLLNLKENIEPTRHRASCVLTKGPNHNIDFIHVRRF
ncbi:type I pantothenate kinase [Stomatohabitans albus]|uniref:type I pantothenate kinase n=1 Tax=Stomatohabitans albus TaxID=3110766 RepID=UPI00300CCB88